MPWLRVNPSYPGHWRADMAGDRDVVGQPSGSHPDGHWLPTARFAEPSRVERKMTPIQTGLNTPIGNGHLWPECGCALKYGARPAVCV
jgi:hypothetical protein